MTIKQPKNPKHDPLNKESGFCVLGRFCTDVTGEHHSYVEDGSSVAQVSRKARMKYGQVTRVEGPI